MPHNNLLIVIGGPTASGKTDWAISLAQKLETAVISADSRQFFKEIPIGTAQATVDEIGSVPHYFMASHSVQHEMSAGQFEVEALKVLNKLFETHKTVVMAGGSGLYIDAVCKGLDSLPVVPLQVRDDLMREYKQNGLEALQERLKRVDPNYYQTVDLNNFQRIIRALEVQQVSGKSFSSFRKDENAKRPFKILTFAIDYPREQLYERINQRVDDMVAKGLVDEARSVYAFRHLYPLKTVGYNELFDYFDGKTSLDEAIALIKRNTRRYAKRQITWFRKNPDAIWLKPDEMDKVFDYIAKIT